MQIFAHYAYQTWRTAMGVSCSVVVHVREEEDRDQKAKQEMKKDAFGSVISLRSELGEYHALVYEVRSDPERFRRYFRLSTSQFDRVLRLISPEIEKLDTDWRRSISPAERLAISLRRRSGSILSHGTHTGFAAVSMQYRTTKQRGFISSPAHLPQQQLFL